MSSGRDIVRTRQTSQVGMSAPVGVEDMQLRAIVQQLQENIAALWSAMPEAQVVTEGDEAQTDPITIYAGQGIRVDRYYNRYYIHADIDPVVGGSGGGMDIETVGTFPALPGTGEKPRLVLFVGDGNKWFGAPGASLWKCESGWTDYRGAPGESAEGVYYAL